MKLSRVHAFIVEPLRHDNAKYEALGGAIQTPPELKAALDEAETLLERKKLEIDLVLDSSNRTSETRELLLGYAFGSTQTPLKSAKSLAERLATSIDERSGACLLVLAAREEGDLRQVSIWTFPREMAFQFKQAKNAPSVELLKDIFSQNSKLRKGASFNGRNIPQDFIRGGALDFQANSSTKLAADFWIVSFLNARLAIRSQAATKVLAKTIVNTHAALTTPAQRAQLFAGVMSIKTNPNKRWSLSSFADTFLDQATRLTFFSEATKLGSVPLSQSFPIDEDTINSTLNVRSFELEGGVLVSAPFSEVDKSVVLQGNELRVIGTVRAERMKARR